MDNFSIPLIRDKRYPVCVTLQYYKVTSNGVVTEIKAQLDNSQNQADFIGSLVTDGLTERPTDWEAKEIDKIASSSDNDKHVKDALLNLGLFNTDKALLPNAQTDTNFGVNNNSFFFIKKFLLKDKLYFNTLTYDYLNENITLITECTEYYEFF
ncbi:hypothetical protein RFI_35667 [Reticulomyxa filosa]|uniref:Uncharacterized protein n=1 Tax=Reticulomyxa filosa TaxID=46433 RepID=X6LKW3_RETFI|nr:hypothetical protein RFI_35667 [Reticulomyxa filosa]|eukprot:ETO01772.1 hypothetical protein RFI_35667 [Reticulomyxa filosa]